MRKIFPVCFLYGYGNLQEIQEEAGSDRTYSLDTLPQEVPSSGVGDYRDDMVRIRQVDGSCAAIFRFDSYEILDHSYAVPGMPALYDTEEEKGETLGHHDERESFRCCTEIVLRSI